MLGVAVVDIINIYTVGAVAIFLTDNNILRNINKAAGQITRVGGTQCGIGKTFTGTAGRNEVFENVKTFTVISSDGNLDGFTCRVCDKSAHTGKLTKLRIVTAGAGVKHHIDGIESLEVLFKLGSNLFCAVLPCLYNIFGALVVGDETSLIILCYLCNLFFSLLKQFFLLRRNCRIANGNRYAASCGILVALSLDFIKDIGCNGCAVNLYAAVDNLTEHLLVDKHVNLGSEKIVGIASVNESEILRNGSIKDNLAESCGCKAGYALAVNLLGHTNSDVYMKTDIALIISHHCLVNAAEGLIYIMFFAVFVDEFLRSSGLIGIIGVIIGILGVIIVNDCQII